MHLFPSSGFMLYTVRCRWRLLSTGTLPSNLAEHNKCSQEAVIFIVTTLGISISTTLQWQMKQQNKCCKCNWAHCLVLSSWETEIFISNLLCLNQLLQISCTLKENTCPLNAISFGLGSRIKTPLLCYIQGHREKWLTHFYTRWRWYAVITLVYYYPPLFQIYDWRILIAHWTAEDAQILFPPVAIVTPVLFHSLQCSGTFGRVVSTQTTMMVGRKEAESTLKTPFILKEKHHTQLHYHTEHRMEILLNSRKYFSNHVSLL